MSPFLKRKKMVIPLIIFEYSNFVLEGQSKSKGYSLNTFFFISKRGKGDLVILNIINYIYYDQITLIYSSWSFVMENIYALFGDCYVLFHM